MTSIRTSGRLVSTTVIEVGVDVPNATVMVIEKRRAVRPERTAPAARACGTRRGGKLVLPRQRQCIGVGAEAAQVPLLHLRRLRVAQYDLETRGPGDFFGSRQHGLRPCRSPI